MVAILGDAFPSLFQGRPPGLGPEDVTVWNAWRPVASRRYTRFWFNVPLTRPTPLAFDDDDAITRMAILNRAFRIDVLADRVSHVDVIELRFAAGFSTLGQVFGYRDMLLQANTFTVPLHMVVVTSVIDPDVRRVATRLGIDMEGV